MRAACERLVRERESERERERETERVRETEREFMKKRDLCPTSCRFTRTCSHVSLNNHDLSSRRCEFADKKNSEGYKSPKIHVVPEFVNFNARKD